MSKILVVNAGSSSIKYQVFHLEKQNNEEHLKVICKGSITDLGGSQCKEEHIMGGNAYKFENSEIKTIEEGIEHIKEFLYSKKGAISSQETLLAIGHRVVHGGDRFSKPTLINNETLSILDDLSFLAPLHNPANIKVIRLCEKFFPSVPQVAVFDTAFHLSIPEVAYRYPVPNKLFEKDKVRVYGFHGTSHDYVTKKAISYAKKENIKHEKIITLHLGNGCSMSAIHNGKCIDTTMGLTPLSGLMMGTRSGNIDPSLFDFLHRRKGYSVDQINALLNKKSGLLGIAGESDMRVIESNVQKGDKNSKLAIDMYVYRIQKNIGAFIAALNGLDILVFTAGIGENSPYIRQRVCDSLSTFNINMDKEKNNGAKGNILSLEKNQGDVTILAIHTDEEFAIAQQTLEITKK